MSDSPRKSSRKLFLSGYNCSQAVLRTVLEERGLMFDEAPLVALGFGGGIGREGGICGAATGAVMAIGVLAAKITTDTKKQKEIAYEYAARFLSQFREEFSTTVCRDLIGYDVSDPASRKEAYDSEIFTKTCPGFVESAVDIVLDMMPI
ncbi:MAG: C-GCAxxG-C-C family protein [Candidatus Thorarchaeota archaeon]